jgi:hypothetical protein
MHPSGERRARSLLSFANRPDQFLLMIPDEHLVGGEAPRMMSFLDSTRGLTDISSNHRAYRQELIPGYRFVGTKFRLVNLGQKQHEAGDIIIWRLQ